MNFNYPIPYVKLYDVVTTSAVASVVLNNLDTNYQFYRIYAYNVRPTSNNVQFLVRMSTNNGATFVSAANTYVIAMEYIRSDNTAAVVTGLGTAMTFTSNASSAGANHNLEFYIDMQTTFSATDFNPIRFTQEAIVSPAAIGLIERNIGTGGLSVPGAVNALQFFFSAGNINQFAKFIVYGYPSL
jgi:hypothetical protein